MENQPQPKGSNMKLILGLSIGGGIAVIALITIILVLVLTKDNSDQDNPTDTNTSQITQRNDSRKSDASIVVTNVVTYTSNNAGGLPSDATTVYSDGAPAASDLGEYFQTQLTVKDVTLYTPSSPIEDFGDFSNQESSGAPFAPDLDTIAILNGQKCDGNTGTQSGTSRSAAIVVKLEPEDDNLFYCLDS